MLPSHRPWEAKDSEAEPGPSLAWVISEPLLDGRMLEWDFIFFYPEFKDRKAAAGSFARVCIQIITGFFALKNERKPGARFHKGDCGSPLWAAGNSSPAQMMDVMGLCEGCGQMLVAFLVLALSGGVQLQSPCK